MADTQPQTPSNGAPEAKAARVAVDAGHRAINTGQEAAHSGIDAEQRSFTEGADAAHRTVDAASRTLGANLRSGQDMVRTGQDAARRTAEQAGDLWRSSLAPMANMQGEMGRLFEQVWRQAFATLPGASLTGFGLGAMSAHPASDLKETEEAIELSVELPGLSADHINLTLRGDALIVAGEREDERDRSTGAYRVSERRFGRFERTFALPPGLDRDSIDARFEDGLLNIRIARLHPVHAPDQRITIKAGSAKTA